MATNLFETSFRKNEALNAYLVGVRRGGESTREAEEHLEELRFLVDTMGIPVVGSEMSVVQHPSPKYLLGTGKVEEAKANAEMAGAGLIIVDDDLTPAQQRNWEKVTSLAVIDRREVILDIFGQRAQTREARLQVELARLEYSLPRLKRAWTHLERQRGGGGFVGGAGEAQIEVDRRIVRDNIAKLKKELETVRRQRATQRKSRVDKPVPTASLVGYTNAGKSSILNKLTGAEVLEENRLFATLDPTTRRILLPNHQELLLTDTVGFIRKLPHMLVEAFMATLEEAKVADLLVHVVDASHPAAIDQIRASNQVLRELGLNERPMIYVFNKADLVEDPLALAELRNLFSPCIITSTITGRGLEDLERSLAEFVAKDLGYLSLRIPASRFDLVSLVHREGHVLSEEYQDNVVVIEADLPFRYHPKVKEFAGEHQPGNSAQAD